MKTLKHDKIYNSKNEIEETIVELSLDVKNDEIDNIIYYLICAQDKANEADTSTFIKNTQIASRLDAAFYRLRDLWERNYKLTTQIYKGL